MKLTVRRYSAALSCFACSFSALSQSAIADGPPVRISDKKVSVISSFRSDNGGGTWVNLENTHLPELATCNAANRWQVDHQGNPMFDAMDRKLHEAKVSGRSVSLLIENRPASCAGRIIQVKVN